MMLRDHPFMSDQGRSNWPPAWVHIAGEKTDPPAAEAGILVEAKICDALPLTCVLYMRHRGALYRASLYFDAEFVSQKVVELLKTYCGRPVSVIGGLEIDDNFETMGHHNAAVFG